MIKRTDTGKLVDLDHCGKQRVSGHQGGIPVEEFSRAVEFLCGDRKNLGENPARRVVDDISIIPAADSAVAVQDLLQRLGIDCCIDLLRGHLFEKLDTGTFVWMIRACRIHHDVGIDQDHGQSTFAVGTDCSFMVPVSATGRSSAASRCRASIRDSTEEDPYCFSQAVRTISPRLTCFSAANRESRS